MLATLGIIQSISRGLTYTPPLDNYAGSAAAYSLRKLRTAYNGSAIRVRRSNDNTEQDIGFRSDGSLDDSALLSFVGNNNGFVTKWYDQSGNTRDAAQTTSANQPRIVNAGTVDKVNYKPAIYCNGSSNILETSNSSASILAIFSLNKSAKSTGVQSIFRKNVSTDNLGLYIHRFDNSNFRFYCSSSGNVIDVQTATTPTNYLLLTSIIDGSTFRQFINGTTGNTSSGTFVNGNSSIVLFGLTGYSEYFSGYVSEIISFSTNSASYRTGIESNINSYYSIY